MICNDKRRIDPKLIMELGIAEIMKQYREILNGNRCTIVVNSVIDVKK